MFFNEGDSSNCFISYTRFISGANIEYVGEYYSVMIQKSMQIFSALHLLVDLHCKKKKKKMTSFVFERSIIFQYLCIIVE